MIDNWWVMEAIEQFEAEYSIDLSDLKEYIVSKVPTVDDDELVRFDVVDGTIAAFDGTKWRFTAPTGNYFEAEEVLCLGDKCVALSSE